MGSLNQYLVDINEDIMARKVVMHKKHEHDGLCSSHVKGYYSTEAPIKKLISEEVFKKRNTRSNSPSVVARLMGVDMLPFDSKPGQQPKKDSVGHVLSSQNCSKQLEVGSIHSKDPYPDQYTSGIKSSKYKPQEEELQKFNKEFEAWQAVRFNECSNIFKGSSPPPQLIALEDLNREKMYRYANCNKTTESHWLREHNDLSDLVDPHEMLTLGCRKKNNLCYSAEGKDSPYSHHIECQRQTLRPLNL